MPRKRRPAVLSDLVGRKVLGIRCDGDTLTVLVSRGLTLIVQPATRLHLLRNEPTGDKRPVEYAVAASGDIERRAS
jgi:hypothetical protein